MVAYLDSENKLSTPDAKSSIYGTFYITTSFCN